MTTGPPATVDAAIVTVTPNPAVDVSTAVDVVEADRKLRCDEPTREAGGGGINVARAIARLGGTALALWASGGVTGALLQQMLDNERVSHHPVPIDGLTRESFAVLERSSGRQFRFGMPGPTMPPDGLDTLIEQVGRLRPSPALVVASGSLPPGVDDGWFGRLADVVSAAGGRFVLDTHGTPLRRALDTRLVYLIKPNLRELSALVGRALDDDAGVAEAARSIVRDGGCKVVVVSLGAAGAVVVTENETGRVRAPAVEVRSPIGAGDSTVAGIVTALMRDEPVGRAVRYGVAAGSAAVMTPGTELCRREDVDSLFSGMQ